MFDGMCKKFGLLILGLSFWICSGCAVNPITGEEQFMLIAWQQEITIGEKYAPEIEKQLGGRIDNEILQKYIDSIGQKVARVSHKPRLEYHFAALGDKSVNALALPGGYIFITKGMLKELQTEAQLAAILAHETAHIVARHSSAAMSREIGISILLSAVTSKKTPQGVLTAADLARRILGLQYSKKDEREADLAGLDYMVRAGYNPYGVVETMQMLQNQQRKGPIEFFSTHPIPRNRMIYLMQKIQTDYDNLAELKIGKEDYRDSVLEQLNSENQPTTDCEESRRTGIISVQKRARPQCKSLAR